MKLFHRKKKEEVDIVYVPSYGVLDTKTGEWHEKAYFLDCINDKRKFVIVDKLEDAASYSPKSMMTDREKDQVTYLCMTLNITQSYKPFIKRDKASIHICGAHGEDLVVFAKRRSWYDLVPEKGIDLKATGVVLRP